MGGYANEMSPAFIKAEMAMFAAAGQGRGHHHHHRPHPQQARARADHRGDGAQHEEGLGHRRPGRRKRRQLRAHPAGRGGRAPRRAHRRLRRPAQPAGPHRHASSTDRTWPTCWPRWAAPKTFHVDLEDEVVRGALVVQRGRGHVAAAAQGARPRRPRKRPPDHAAAPLPAAAPPAPATASAARLSPPSRWRAGGGAGRLRAGGAPEFLSHLTVFALACVVGWQVIWNVTPALHTPLMSVTNAISGIIVVGGMLQVSGPLVVAGHHPGRRRHPAGRHQHRGRVPGHAADAAHVPQVGQPDVGRPMLPQSLVTLAYIVAGLLFIFSLSGLSAQESAAPRQHVRHGRHGARRGRHGAGTSASPTTALMASSPIAGRRP